MHKFYLNSIVLVCLLLTWFLFFRFLTVAEDGKRMDEQKVKNEKASVSCKRNISKLSLTRCLITYILNIYLLSSNSQNQEEFKKPNSLFIPFHRIVCLIWFYIWCTLWLTYFNFNLSQNFLMASTFKDISQILSFKFFPTKFFAFHVRHISIQIHSKNFSLEDSKAIMHLQSIKMQFQKQISFWNKKYKKGTKASLK